MQYDTVKLYTHLTVPSSIGSMVVGVWKDSTVVRDIGKYGSALAMRDGPLGGEVVETWPYSSSALQLVQTFFRWDHHHCSFLL